MAAQKRSRTGAAKLPSTTITTTTNKANTSTDTDTPTANPSTKKQKSTHAPSQTRPKETHTKRARLPPQTTPHPRPLLRAALPSPFASSQAQKTLYLTASSPFIPTVKRARSLLAQIAQRGAQSASTSTTSRGRGGNAGLPLANGRLGAQAVEAGIVAGVKDGREGGSRKGAEAVYVKATGRAIPRALAVGVVFQGEAEWCVRVEMGSVRAVDDVLVTGASGGGEEGEGEEVPETRLRTLSCVTVAISAR